MRTIEYLPLTKLKPSPKNPKEHDVSEICDSIERFGFVSPIVVDARTHEILAGHGRRKALIELKSRGNKPPDGIKTKGKANTWLVPTLVGYETKSDTEASAYRIGDNQLTILGGWDDQILADSLDELSELGLLDGIGFDDDSVDSLVAGLGEDEKMGLIDDDEVPDIESRVKVQPGDRWELGDHRIYCGDTTNPDDVERLFRGKKVGMVFTDPPYGMDFQGSVNGDGSPSANRKLKQISNETGTDADKKSFIEQWLPAVVSLTEAAWYVCYSRHNLRNMLNVIDEIKAPLRNMIIWNKNRQNVANTDYKPKYELILYGWDKHRFFGEMGDNDVWSIDKLNKATLHPTMKPVDLVLKALTNSSRKNDIVADLFLGSGSTLIAAEKIGRRCYGMEIDPHYCEVVITRWEEFTGKEATLGK